MKITLFIFSFCFSLSLFAQNNPELKNYFIPLNQYHKRFQKPLTKKDSLNFIYREADTLVLINGDFKTKGTSVPYEYKDDNFLDIYSKVAFNNNVDSLKNKTTMKYWKEDLSIFFSKSVNKKTKKEFIKFSKEVLKHIDSISFKVVKKVEDSNFIIYYSGDFEYESRMRDYKNSDYYISWNGKNQLYRQSIRLNADHYFNVELRLRKLKEFFIKSLGQFKFDNSLDCENFFSGCYQENIELTKLDIEILKYHYSYGICKGTNYKIFIEQHKKAKEILKKKNSRIIFQHDD